MEILGLRLRGFIGIKKGMGLDEIDIDFSKLKGLIAFDGPNGHGKTTILDNMHPFRCLASRNKALQHHTFLRDSEKEFCFNLGDDHYRALLKIDSDSDRSEGYIYKNGAGHSETNGKVSEYDVYISELFGSQNLFFNSIFCAQNAGKLSDMTTGDLKALVSEFLRLQALIQHEDTSKQCGKVLSGQIEDIGKEIDTLNREIASLNADSGKVENLKKQLSDSEKYIGVHKQTLIDNETKLDMYRQALAKNDIIDERIKGHQENIDRINSEIESDKIAVGRSLLDIKNTIYTIRDEIKTCDGLMASLKEYEYAADVVTEKTQRLGSLEKRLDEIQSAHNESTTEINHRLSRRSETNLAINKILNDSTIPLLQSEIRECEGKLVALDKKAPECQSTTCSFIAGALEAKDRLPELEKKLKNKELENSKSLDDLKAVLSANDTAIKAAEKEISDFSNTAKATRNQIADIKKEIEEAQKMAALLPSGKSAEEKKALLKSREDELIAEGVKINQDHENRVKAKADEQKRHTDAIFELQAAHKPGLPKKIAEVSEEITYLKLKIDDLVRIQGQFRIDIDTAVKEESKLKDKQNQLFGLVDKKTTLTNELADWQYIKLGCSKDGLRALEIDSVAPIVTGYANDLLNSTFGPSYTVKFRTQDEETGKEILDILAIREDGTEALLENLSGGEKVWSLKALRLAMTLLAKEKSGKNFLTALADEEDGALDTENALNFISMYRAFMATGGFNACFFITHRKECVALADHVLRFAKGGVTIE